MTDAGVPDEPFTAIIDADLGNPGSCLNMLRRIGAPAVLTSDSKIIASAARLILPGVGAFDQGMRNLHRRGLIEPLSLRCPSAQGSRPRHLSRNAVDGPRKRRRRATTGLGWLAFRCSRFSFGTQTRVAAQGAAHGMGHSEASNAEHELLVGCGDASQVLLRPLVFLPVGYRRRLRCVYPLWGGVFIRREPRQHGLACSSILRRATISECSFWQTS